MPELLYEAALIVIFTSYVSFAVLLCLLVLHYVVVWVCVVLGVDSGCLRFRLGCVVLAYRIFIAYCCVRALCTAPLSFCMNVLIWRVRVCARGRSMRACVQLMSDTTL